MRVKLLGAYIDALNMDQTVERVVGFVQSGRLHRIITLNPEYLYQAQSRRELLNLANSADLVTADGNGIVWGCKMAQQPVSERITGIDLMLRLCARGDHLAWRVFLLGAAPGVAKEAAANLKRQYPGLIIVGTNHGYFTENESDRIVAIIRQANPQLLFVALGAPRQEQWIAQHQPRTNVAVAVGVGGSFDVLSGRKQRAPKWVQQIKLEWLHRLVKDPARWQRQLILPKFTWLVLKRYLLKI
ncbi:MAG: WecB/TagA/CpsF family glycosyltransferase [Desulfotomaculum sp.]|nr:WecB/TagA/CpsF family glycosyltransferase [Desulfotomaculum sp.]